MEDAGETEDEITRCICGYQEYQSPDDDQTENDGLFIQCDGCKVWQHGFCVGIMDSESTPEEYFCEKCKPELHREGHNKAGWVDLLFCSLIIWPAAATDSFASRIVPVGCIEFILIIACLQDENFHLPADPGLRISQAIRQRASA